MAVRYLILQWQRCLKSILKTIGILFVILVVATLVVLGAMKALEASEVSLVDVGIVIPEDEVTSLYVTELIASMDSVKSICSFRYYDAETDAVSDYRSGKLKAAIIIPQGFYHDVQTGLNPPAIIYIDDSDIVSRIFKDILTVGVSYLQQAEAAVYASLDTSNIFEEETQLDLGNSIALKYVDVIMRRSRLFNSRLVLAFDGVSMIQYYMASLIIVVLLFSGVTFNRMYFAADRAAQEQLSIRGLGRWKSCLLKIIVMTPIIYIGGCLLYIICQWISVSKGITNNSFTWSALGHIWIIALTMAIYFELIYEITGDGKQGVFVLIIFNIIGIAMSGIIIPSVYMSGWVQQLGKYVPENWWMRILLNAIVG